MTRRDYEKCESCGGDAADNWFDRSLCPCSDAMHTRCVNCGHALDGCPYDSPIATTGRREAAATE